MGVCMSTTNNQDIRHPSLGSLEITNLKGRKCLSLSMHISNEEDYLCWLKKVSKLKYNQQLKDYLYLPISEQFNKKSHMCNTDTKLEVILPTYIQTVEELVLSHQSKKRYFTELEIWYLIVLFIKCFNYAKKRKQIIRPKIQNLLVTDDGKLRIIPDVLLSTWDLNNEIIDLSVFKKSHSQSTQADINKSSPIYQAGLICLSISLLDIIDPENREIDEEILQNKLLGCRQRYSSVLIEQLKDMLFHQNDSDSFLQTITKRAQLYINEIQEQMQLKAIFGQFEDEKLGDTHKFIENVTPKHSRMNLRTYFNEDSIDDKDREDFILEKEESIFERKNSNTLSLL